MESLFPWLMFFKKDNDICNFIDPKHNDTYFTEIPELLSGAQIRFSKDGWLLMSRSNHSIFFFNPFTRAEIQLPDIDCYHFTGISFSSSPTSSDSVVFGICDCCVDIIRKGEEDWSRYPIDYRPYNNNPVFYNGAFYCLGREGNIGVFDLKDDRFTWTVLAKPKRPCMLNYQNFLIECDGELTSVFVGRMGKLVQVFRLNCSKMVWTEVESLGNHMLFVSHSSSLSAVAKTPQMENKIYFPRFRSNSIVYYSLETGMYHSFGSEHSAPDFYDTREQLHCGWIEPRWFRTTEDEIHWHGDTHCL